MMETSKHPNINNTAVCSSMLKSPQTSVQREKDVMVRHFISRRTHVRRALRRTAIESNL